MGITTQRTEGTVAFDRTGAAGPTAELSAEVRQELHCQFESAVAFADYCSFLTAGTCGELSAQLIKIAEDLIEQTTETLRTADRPH